MRGHLYLIGKRDFGVDAYTPRNVVARWFFMAALTGGYTASPKRSCSSVEAVPVATVG
jgi:hypothetical protein